MNRTDLADPHTGILASFDQHRPLAVFERGASGQDARFELETSPAGPRLELGDEDLLGHWTIASQRLCGRLRGGDGSTTEIEAIGASCSGSLPAGAAEDPAGDAGDPAILRRSIVICFEDASLLAITTAKATPTASHDGERMAAAQTTAAGDVTSFAQPLLSTEYDAAGRQRRATLELWPEESDESGPLRGGGLAVAVSELKLPGARSTLAFFEWSVAGRPGIGRYEIIRAL